MIEISDLMSDPDFAQDFTIRRESGAFVEGEWIKSTADIAAYGVIQPAKSPDVLAFAPEGERQGNWIVVYCAAEVRQGNADDLMSDVIIWRGDTYRVAKAKHWETQGFWQVWAKGFVGSREWIIER